MPRNSPFPIMLSRREKVKLQSIAAKYMSSYCEVIRAKIILLADNGVTNKEIAARVSIPRQVVSKWRKRFYLEK